MKEGKEKKVKRRKLAPSILDLKRIARLSKKDRNALIPLIKRTKKFTAVRKSSNEVSKVYASNGEGVPLSTGLNR